MFCSAAPVFMDVVKLVPAPLIIRQCAPVICADHYFSFKDHCMTSQTMGLDSLSLFLLFFHTFFYIVLYVLLYLIPCIHARE